MYIETKIFVSVYNSGVETMCLTRVDEERDVTIEIVKSDYQTTEFRVELNELIRVLEKLKAEAS